MTRQIPLVAFTESRLYPLLTQSDNKLRQLQKNIKDWDADIPYGIVMCVYKEGRKDILIDPAHVPEDVVSRYDRLWPQGLGLSELLVRIADTSEIDDNPYLEQFEKIVADSQDIPVSLWQIYEVTTAISLKQPITDVFDISAISEITGAILSFYQNHNDRGFCLGVCFEVTDGHDAPLVTSVTNIPLTKGG